MGEELEDRYVRQARNEALFREVNERIAELDESAQSWSIEGTIHVFCECGAEGGCGERLTVPARVYETVRQQDDRFLVRPGHAAGGRALRAGRRLTRMR